jgi:hypothetical protein
MTRTLLEIIVFVYVLLWDLKIPWIVKEIFMRCKKKFMRCEKILFRFFRHKHKKHVLKVRKK